jgi:cyclophilin family peptidyl-prolyl cis-trans isomerase
LKARPVSTLATLNVDLLVSQHFAFRTGQLLCRYAPARRESEPNSASSQFFFLLKESELTPSGTNILDGRYSVFGYVIEGQELLREVKVGSNEKQTRPN